MSEMESEIWGPRWMERRDPCRCRMAYDEGESGSADQRISGGMRPHGGAEARRKQREEPTTGHKGNWRVPCSCMCVETPVLVAHRCFTLPRSSSILCGCINMFLADKSMWYAWGRDALPHVRCMY
jgi:hypothetical protein